MRIAYLTHQYFPRHVGGTEVYTRGLARRAKAAGHEVIVITAHDPISRDKALRGIRPSEFERIPLAEIHYSLGTAPD
ncbi:MAG TPA: glycosyltransferase, partial [Candidatus Omnitrophota bacterium]|nr:glycosyltransferase [Candidatus Omnitrophota bacterium]